MPNQLLRDVQAIHPNVTFADLPKALQDQIAESTRAAFTQLLKEGYAVGPRQQMQARARWTGCPSGSGRPATDAVRRVDRGAARRAAANRRPQARRQARSGKPRG